MFVVLTVCLVLGHTGRFARSGSCVYGVRIPVGRRLSGPESETSYRVSVLGESCFPKSLSASRLNPWACACEGAVPNPQGCPLVGDPFPTCREPAMVGLGAPRRSVRMMPTV